MVIFFSDFSKAGTVKCADCRRWKIGLEKLSAILKNSPATQVRLVATVISSEVRALSSDYRMSVCSNGLTSRRTLSVTTGDCGYQRPAGK